MSRKTAKTNSRDPLIDSFGRVHNSLRVSVTDRCNIRCFYCMPMEVVFQPREELLTFEEIRRFVAVSTELGVEKFRITGGEPLVRKELPSLIRMLAKLPGVDDLALTTNGMLLSEQAEHLKAAGLRRLNVSLDTLKEETFERISRRKGLQQVLDGIFAAQKVGFENIRLNAVAIRGLIEDDIIPLVQFARDHGFELRFIEFMPLDAEGNWTDQRILTGASIRSLIENEFCPLEPTARVDPSQPAVDYRFTDGRGRIGFINPVSEPFCGNCNRLRLTAEGQVRNCLFSTTEWDARALLRGGGTDEQLRQLIRRGVMAKAPSHGIGQAEFQRPERAMYQIGG